MFAASTSQNTAKDKHKKIYSQRLHFLCRLLQQFVFANDLFVLALLGCELGLQRLGVARLLQQLVGGLLQLALQALPDKVKLKSPSEQVRGYSHRNK